MKPSIQLFAAALGVVGGATSAAADEGSHEDRLTIPAGHGQVSALLAINLSADAAFEPVSLSPDLWYGATDKITVGLVHSGRGASGLLGGVGQSLCLAGESHGCADVYGNAGVAGRFDLKRGTTAIAAEAGLFATGFDPFTLQGKLGAAFRWHQDRIAVEAAPGLFLALTERDTSVDGLVVPVTGSYAATPAVALALQAGLTLPFEATGDTTVVSLSLGARYAVATAVALEAAFSLPAIAGGDAIQTGVDARVLSLGGGYAF